MRRRRPKSTQPGVSLFPFLAVLICTLGVLIVLLVLAVKSASIKQADHANAIAESAAETQAELTAKREQQRQLIDKLEDDIDRSILEAEGFEEMRPEARRELTSARDYRAHLEKELAELESQAQRLVDEMKLLDEDRKDAVVEVDDNDLQRLRDQVELAKSRLEQKRSEVTTIEQKKYAIVPYHGTGGTKRVPVFVECNRDGLVLQPWGIKLSREDFFHPVAAGNPVDAALSTVRNYYQQHELADKDQRPYPLLVVRPDGAQSYGLARRSLISWDDEFGYELVSQEKDLDFGTIDPQLESEIQDAVKKSKLTQLALRQRRAALASARRGFAQDGGVGAGAGNSGGFGSSSQRGSSARKGGFSPASAGTGQKANQQVAYQESESRGESGGDFGSPNSSEMGTDSPGPQDVANGGDFQNSKIASRFDSNNSRNTNASFASSMKQGAGGSNANGTTTPSDSLANARGADWALPTQTSGATGYVRPVGLVCGKDSLAIKNVAGDTIVIPYKNQPAEAIDKMVNIIWQRIDAWGIAGASAYWKPNLAVVVEPGARQQFQSIKQMLRGSGLGIEEVSP
ncbi:hypothetical protein [Mariniblastus fucicola]|uniref:IncA protein n=1 Tax=Mariniblastus fucicola TaxID=980251 RepID=A0A5B9PNV4_9BACT|nr:hypothetical protein [Mariniblastus fucicola]QEG23933.1 hypothetical protein MFFC18_38380 [Mariniblastus fucicola]